MMLSKPVEEVAKLKVENYFVYRHTQKIKQELVAEDIDEAQAEILSTTRVFSNECGTYGTNLELAYHMPQIPRKETVNWPSFTSPLVGFF